MSKIRVTHVITGLSTGGAENVLYQLVSRLDREAFSNTVISLTDFGRVARRIAEAGIPVTNANLDKVHLHFRPAVKLISDIRKSKPHLVQTWMYHGDLIGGFVSRLVMRVPVIWNLRQSNFDQRSSKKSTVAIARLCAKLSDRMPAAIVCGSNAAHDCHIDFGYSPNRMVVLPNGFDTDRFQPNPQFRLSSRQELGVSDEDFLVGLVGRFDPQKDHATFLAAAAQVAERVPNARFALCGEGVDIGNPLLKTGIDRYGLGDRIYLLGLRSGLETLYPAFDVLALSSAYGEGAPNVLGEAMACGVPCVATDIGDSALIVGRTGRVVPARDPDALAASLCGIAEMEKGKRQDLGGAARERISKEFDIKGAVERYAALYRRVFSQRYGPPSAPTHPGLAQ